MSTTASPKDDKVVEAVEAVENVEVSKDENAKEPKVEVNPFANLKPNEVPEGYSTVSEGQATVLYKKGEVFYNEVQIKNRDLSVLVLNEYAKQLGHEADEQFRRRTANVSWRKLPTTKQTWGPEFAKDAATIDNVKAIARDEAAKAAGKEQREITTERGELTGMRILEGLSATGLRSIRYAKEITDGVGVDKIIANDLETHAVNAIRANLNFNGMKDGEKVLANEGDATLYMYNHRTEEGSAHDHTRIRKFIPKEFRDFNLKSEPFDVVDLDPYGSPSPFLDAAVQCVRDGGLLAVTATDLSTLCGKTTDMCFPRYRAQPIRVARFPHEFAIRILLGFIETTANQYGRHIVPILSVHMDFYIRVFVRVHSNKGEAKLAPTKLSYAAHSRACDNFFLQPLATDTTKNNNISVRPADLTLPSKCPETGAAMVMGGPIWSDPIHNFEFVNALRARFASDYKPEGEFDARKLGAAEMVHALVANVADEVPNAPLHYTLSAMCRAVHCENPSMDIFQSAIINAGYKVSKTHSSADHVKTDAPPALLWDIIRVWVRDRKPVNKKHTQDPDGIPAKILSKEITHEVNLTIAREIRRRKLNNNVVNRYKGNPKPNWGPKPAAAGSKARQTHRRARPNANGAEADANDDKQNNETTRNKRARKNDNVPDWEKF